MTPSHEHYALSSRALTNCCPACLDGGRDEVGFGPPLYPRRPGPPEVECEEGHRFVTAEWSSDAAGYRYVLSRRVAL